MTTRGIPHNVHATAPGCAMFGLWSILIYITSSISQLGTGGPRAYATYRKAGTDFQEASNQGDLSLGGGEAEVLHDVFHAVFFCCATIQFTFFICAFAPVFRSGIVLNFFV